MEIYILHIHASSNSLFICSVTDGLFLTPSDQGFSFRGQIQMSAGGAQIPRQPDRMLLTN